MHRCHSNTLYQHVVTRAVLGVIVVCCARPVSGQTANNPHDPSLPVSTAHAGADSASEPRTCGRFKGDLSRKEGGGSGRVVLGLPVDGYPAVGLLLSTNSDGTRLCTGTLIGSQTFLTARHCVQPSSAMLPPGAFRVYFQHAGIFRVKEAPALPPKPSYIPPGKGSQADIAILTLDGPVTGIRPIPINDRSEIANADDGETVGYGITEVGADAGIKRLGKIHVSSCSPGMAGAEQLICWKFNLATAGIRGGSPTNTCHGDSGGPLLSTLQGARQAVAGVTSGGTDAPCGTVDVDHSYDTSVFFYREWIKSKIVPASSPADSLCEMPDEETLSPNPRLTERKLSDFHAFAPGDMETSYQFELSEAKELRVGLNPVFTTQDIKISVTSLSSPAASIVCDNAFNIAHSCIVKDPPQGKWEVAIKNMNGKQVQYQIVISAF